MRRRKDKPIEQLRPSWTSTEDLAETLSAMFNRPMAESPAPLPTSGAPDFSAPDLDVHPDTSQIESAKQWYSGAPTLTAPDFETTTSGAPTHSASTHDDLIFGAP